MNNSQQVTKLSGCHLVNKRNVKFSFCFTFYLIILAIVNGIPISYAQTFTTPEVFSFKQETFRPISYYTGQANILVPICQIKTSEITIPISLNYIGGEGLRPLHPYSNVGLGWKLSAGGAITRTKNNICDECIVASSSYSDYGTKGFFHLAQSSVTTTNDYVRNNVGLYSSGSWTTTTGFNWYYDYSPDVFSFNFLGYSGYFVMGLDKVFHIQSNDIVKVEWFNSSLGGIGDYIIYFKLTANDGTIFTFGSTAGSVEISGGQNDVPYQSNAWYLTEIKFINGRTISFNYQRNYDVYLYFKTSSDQLYASTMNPVVLKDITFNGGKVVFTSSTRSHNISNPPSQLSLIDKVELQTASGQKISQTNLTYSATPNTRYYMLNTLIIDDKHYSFGYNSPNSLPSMTQAYGTDYWGFYNGQLEATTPNIPSGYRDAYLNQTLTFPAKMPSEANTKLGILTSLTYPTGEVEYYEYESNTYSYVGVETLSGYYNSYFQPNKVAGGLRIARITLGNQVRKYKYVTSFDPNNPDLNAPSSGILYKFPAVAFRTEPEALNFLSVEGEPPLVYSRVIEYLSDKSYTEYNMNSPLNRPDGINNQNANYYTANASLVINNVAVENNEIFNYISKSTFVGALGKNSSCALERGQVAEIKVFDSSNNLKKSIAYTYSSDPNRYNQYVAALYVAGTGHLSTAQRFSSLSFELGLQYLSNSSLKFDFKHSYCIYTFPVFLEKEEVTEYYSGTPVTTTTEYTYNAQKLKATEKIYDSKNGSVQTKYRYPSDVGAGIYSSMATLKMLNYPVEITSYRNDKVVGSKLTTYKSNSTSYVPDKEYLLNITSPLTSITQFNGTTKDSHYNTYYEISYDTYSTYGNLRQSTGSDNITTAYLWDATGIYLMARAKGATYSQLSSKDGRDCTSASDNLWSEINTAVSSSMIETSSYSPLRGAVSYTNTQGVTSYYSYDTSGRLFLVRNDDKNIISKYRYAYKNYPDNGIGGYATLSVSLTTPTPPEVLIGQNNTASATVSGGTGNYKYNWYLKKSTGTVEKSSLNSSSSSFIFSCDDYGPYYITCEVIDNELGISYTKNSSNITSCVSVCSFTPYSGITNLSSSIVNYGTSALFYLTFYANFEMQPNVSYLVETVSSACRPSATRTFTVYEVMGRTWQVTINSSGAMYWKMTAGTALPAYESQSTGTITYNL
jgi:hypothetical protein